MLHEESKVYIAGHQGMVGSGILRNLRQKGLKNFTLKTKKELNLTQENEVHQFFKNEKPEIVVLAAAKVGGILANKTYPVEFLLYNLRIQNNVIQFAAEYGVKKLLFLGSSCIYPKLAPQPIQENSLLTGELEKTNEAYAIAKIAGLKLCEYYFKEKNKNFISAMPTNLYGTGDNYHPENSHVIPALIRKFYLAKKNQDPHVTLWGSGSPKREFLHVDDLCEALWTLLTKYESSETVNVGTGEDLAISDLAELIKELTGFEGKLVWDSSKPDGTPRKVLDVSRISALGWKPKLTLREGLKKTIKEFENEPKNYL